MRIGKYFAMGVFGSGLLACGGATSTGKGSSGGAPNDAGSPIGSGGARNAGGASASSGGGANGGGANGGNAGSGGDANTGGTTGSSGGSPASPADASTTDAAVEGDASPACPEESSNGTGNTDASIGPTKIPAGLWEPPNTFTPPPRNYVYLASDTGDYVGQGNTYTYTQIDSVLKLTPNGVELGVDVNGDEQWMAEFAAMNRVAHLEAGFYDGATRYPFNDPSQAGFDWSGEGRGCNTETGWFVVDSISYECGVLSAIDLRFEQHCEGAAPSLHGKLHWSTKDHSTPPGPVSPPPANLWTPAAGATPATGNYIYLASDPGDYIGGGVTKTFTPISASSGRPTLSVSATSGTDFEDGHFQGMSGLDQLQVGYYPNLRRWPFQNPARGGLDWNGNGSGCDNLSGWFVVDGISFNGTTLKSVDLRFEQHCEFQTPALHGAIHYVAP
jgi:hypothetical protein